MTDEKVFAMTIARIYPLLVQKAERKGRTQAEVNTVICWLTGYDTAGLAMQVQSEATLETFFNQAPQIHPNAARITGIICGVRVEEITDPLMQNIRRMDKLVDELAKGKAMEKILRTEASPCK
ncbi:MAG: DUF2200 domain-containing protein [Defluviitaleaceae bacterium]|nr:DUF2200 domain-containing protein [Defluviitaleaceae bacterium]